MDSGLWVTLAILGLITVAYCLLACLHPLLLLIQYKMIRRSALPAGGQEVTGQGWRRSCREECSQPVLQSVSCPTLEEEEMVTLSERRGPA